MSRPNPSWLVLGVALVLVGCVHRRSARKPVQMVAMPAPAPEAHAKSSVPVGGAAAFEADEVVSCEADPPGLVRAYAMPESFMVIGERAGWTTLRLRLQSGDEFYLDLTVTNQPTAYQVLAVGEQLALPLAGVKAYSEKSECVKATPNADGTQLIVLGEKPCTALVGMTLDDGTTRATEIVVVGGQRLL